MLLSARGLEKYHLDAEDGEIGKVVNLYFDEQDWSVRYLVVQTGNFLSGRAVLIWPDMAGMVEPERQRIPVAMTKEEIRNSPLMDAHMPVHRQKEMVYFQQMGWTPYWQYSPTGTAGVKGVPPDPSTSRSADILEGQNPYLRDTWKIIRYKAVAQDGEGMGHVDDFIVDAGGWKMRYVVLEARKWPHLVQGDKRLVPVEKVSCIDWETSTVDFGLFRSEAESGPTFEPADLIDPDTEKAAREYYGRLG